MKNLNTYIRDDFHGSPTGWNTWWDEEFNADYFSWQWPSSSGNYVVYDNEDEEEYQILSPKKFPISGDCIIEWELYTDGFLFEDTDHSITLMNSLDQEIAQIVTHFKSSGSTVAWESLGSVQDSQGITFIGSSRYKYKIERVNGVLTGYYEVSYGAGWTAMANPLANHFEDFYIRIGSGFWNNFNYFDFKAESGFPYLTHPNQVSRTKVSREGDILMGL